MYEEESKKSFLRFIISTLFMSVFVFIMCSFIFNSCRMSDSDIADDVIFDDKTDEVYKSSPDDFEVYTYDIEKRFEAIDGNQLLQLKYLYYIPSARQMQITIKYNTGYASPATDTYLPFELILKNHLGDVYEDYFYEFDEKSGYGYIRICWNNVDFTQDSEHILYINQEINGKMISRGSFLMQKATTAKEKTKLTKNNAPNIYNR